MLRLASIPGDAGQDVVFDEVLALLGDSTKLGQPLIKGAKVTAQIVRHVRGEKLVVFKFRKRKRSRKKAGHRQAFTAVRITGVKG